MTLFLVLMITILTSLACAVVGNLLVLRRLSLMGDAMSHSMLPGIVLAFLLVGTLSSPVFFLFAVIFALVMSVSVDFLTEKARIFQESSIGIVFTTLFALGVILLVRYANNVHIDEHAVLYGNVEFAAFNKLIISGVDLGPKAFWVMGLSLFLNLAVIILFYKEFKLTIFDPATSKSLGISPRVLHYLMIFLVSMTVVLAFEITGVILVVALLIIPGAAASLIAKNLWQMVVFSMGFAVLSSVSGFAFAIWIDSSIAGAVAMMSGVWLMVGVLLKNLKVFSRG